MRTPRFRTRSKLLALLAAASILATFSVASALAVHDHGDFELDKDATDGKNHVTGGYLAATLQANGASINVCLAGGTKAVTGDIIRIRQETMVVGVVTDPGTFNGNCDGGKITYAVDRSAPPANTKQPGGANEVGARVSIITDALLPGGPDWDAVEGVVTDDDEETNCDDIDLLACAFIEDGVGPSTFTGGSTKDYLPIEGWLHNTGASPDKAEIMNAYAAKTTDAENHEILYFGMDRQAVDGSTDIGFWFFQDQVVACPNPDAPAEACEGVPNGEFAGTHVEGDVLALGTFTQGGATTNIRVFKWVDENGSEQENIDGPLDTFGDCFPGEDDDNGCATVNTTTIGVPWNYTFKNESTGGWIPAGGFFEGGVDLTFLEITGCFNSFLAESRSSPEITAVLIDFALGEFESCDSGLTTTPSDSAGVALPDTVSEDDTDTLGEISIGTGVATVTDSADLDVTGAEEWDGTLTFYLCGPEDGIATCDENGTEVSSHVLDELSDNPTVSDTATVTSVGEYCFAAFFVADTEGVPDAEDVSAGECFEVLPVDPTISTDATEGPVEVGGTVDDIATLLGTASQPGDPIINGDPGADAAGTITFTAYGPHDNTTTCTTVAYSSIVDVSGDGPYTASSGTGGVFTPTAAGIYNWIAVYSGDDPNTNDVSGSCGDENETSEISPVTPAIETVATAGPVPLGDPIDDTATLSGTAPQPDGDPAEGTITFTAYGPHNDTTTCTTVAYTSVVNVSGDGPYTASSGTGGVFTPTAAGTYNWIAVYSGDPPNTDPVSGECGDANEGSVVISLQPGIATAQSWTPQDEATITVAAGGGPLEGSVDFALYENATCTGTPAYSEDNVALDIAADGLSATAETDNSIYVVTADKHVYWTVFFDSTNPAHEDATSSCVEDTDLTIDNVTAPVIP